MSRPKTTMTQAEVLAAIIAHREMLMTQAEAAKRYGCKPPYWCELERGRKSASVEVLEKMARAVGLKLEFTLSLDD